MAAQAKASPALEWRMRHAALQKDLTAHRLVHNYDFVDEAASGEQKADRRAWTKKDEEEEMIRMEERNTAEQPTPVFRSSRPGRPNVKLENPLIGLAKIDFAAVVKRLERTEQRLQHTEQQMQQQEAALVQAQQRIAQSQHEFNELKDSMLCAVCIELPRTVLVLPCCQLAYCKPCAAAMLMKADNSSMRCALCNQPATALLNIFP